MFQLSFLNTSVLFLSLAATIPLLIYLFISKKPRQVIFSTIRHIKASQQQQKKKIKLKNLLLLIIRTLIILLTILAIARPAIKSRLLTKWSKHSPTAVAIILDTSYSMDYLVDTRTDLEIGKDLIRTINNKLTDKDAVILITSDEDWNQLYSNVHFGKLPENLLGSIEITPLPKQLPELVEFATLRLKETQLINKEIYLINNLRKQELPKKSDYPILIIPTSKKEDWNNLSCQNARIVEDFIERKVERRIAFEIVNHSQYNQQDVVCQLFVNGNVVSEKAVNLQAYEKKSEYFDLQVNNPGWYSGYVSVKNERLQYDNRSYFSFYNELNPKVTVISDSERIPLPLSSVLEIYTKKLENIKIISDDNLNREKLNDSNFIIVYGKRELSPKLQFLLEQLKEQGTGVLFVTSKEISSSWKEYYQSLFNVALTEYSKSKVRVSYLNLHHPIMSIFDKKEQDLVDIEGYWMSRALSNANLLAQGGHNPLIIENNRQVLWLFDLSNFKSDILIDPMFPVLAYRTFLYCSNLNSPNMTVGESITVPEKGLVLPNEELYTTNKRSYVLKQQGIYTTYDLHDKETRLAANINYSHSDYEPLKLDNKGEITILDETWENSILRSRYGVEIWRYLFFIALLLIIIEIFLVKREEKQS